MANKGKNKTAVRAKTKSAYLTKRVVVSAAGSAIRSASAKAMSTAGYTVEVKNGWVVKKFKDGTTKRLEKVKTAKRPAKIVLD